MISNSISYGKQEITEEDIAAVISTLKSDFLTQGQKYKNLKRPSQNILVPNTQ